jgi:hypothetical protein
MVGNERRILSMSLAPTQIPNRIMVILSFKANTSSQVMTLPMSTSPPPLGYLVSACAVKSTDNEKVHENIADLIGLLNSEQLFASSLQAATSAEEKFRLARCMAHCNMTSIKSSPACNQVIAELISVLNYARGTQHDTVIQKLIQELEELDGSCNELFEHLVASVQAAPSAAEISRISR